MNGFAKQLGVAALAIAQAGCVHFQPKPLATAETAAEFQSRSLTTASLKGFLEDNLQREFPDWPHPLWDFDMLALAGFYYHPSLAVARAQWHVAQAGVKTAGGRPNPTLTVMPGYNISALPGVNPWFPAINLDVPVETAGKRSKRISQAEHLSEAARLNIATAAWQVRSGVRSSLLESAAAHQRAALLQGQVSVQEQIVKLLEQQAEAGAIASSYLASFRVARQRARLDLANAQSQLAEARSRMAGAIGVPLNAIDEAELSFDPLQDFPAPTNLLSAGVRDLALRGRADILGALAGYAASEDALRLEIARQYPDVHLNPGYQFDQGEHKWSLGISADLPVLNRNQGPIAEAEARREEAAARFNELQAKVLTEIERAAETFRVSGKNSATLQSLAADSEKQRASVEAQFKVGSVERLDFLNVQLESITSRLVLLDGQVKLQQAIAALEDAVQRPLAGGIFSGEKVPAEKENKK